MKIKDKIVEILNSTIGEETEIFSKNLSTDDKIKILPAESLLALQFITHIEDEFEIEFEDDELDIDFFTTIDTIELKVAKHVKNN